jgi:hypothetical protein
MRNKLALFAISTLILSLLFSSVAIASDDNKSSASTGQTPIPLYMKPDTIIVYDDNLNMTIVQGGISKSVQPPVYPMVVPPLPTGLPKNQEESFKKLQQDMAKDIQNGATNSYPVLYPVAGEKVIYGDDGYIQQCYFKDDSDPSGYSIHLPNTIITPNTITTTDHWGNYNNYISYNTSDGSTGSTTGYGRFTQYTGYKGYMGKILSDGDVATDMELDTIGPTTTIDARNDDPSSPGYGTFYGNYHKNDVGPLCGPLYNNGDDAVLDVWGANAAGLEHLGVPSGPYVSLNAAHYYHQGISYSATY